MLNLMRFTLGVVKPKLEFQQKLVAVQTFMEYYDLPTSLKVRVVQFYELQQQGTGLKRYFYYAYYNVY